MTRRPDRYVRRGKPQPVAATAGRGRLYASLYSDGCRSNFLAYVRACFRQSGMTGGGVSRIVYRFWL